MTKKILVIGGSVAALGLALAVIPSPSAKGQSPDESALLEQKLEQMQRKIDALQTGRLQATDAAVRRALQAAEPALRQYQTAVQEIEGVQDVEGPTTLVVEGPSWLGVETAEVTSDVVKERKLPAERGVVIHSVTPDSPAAKAGLKENDVITEVDGQRIEGAAQFRRMIHEIPPGRTIPLVVWRDGRPQTISVTLGRAEERHTEWMKSLPGNFAFQMPEVRIPEMPSIDMNGEFVLAPGSRGRLGIDAEEIEGQLGTYFGAPDGEGILVRSVNSGSPAEKSGMKAGDVITSVNGERVRTVGDLRESLAKAEDKPVKVGVLRNRNEMTLTVELPPRSAKSTRKLLTHRTFI